MELRPFYHRFAWAYDLLQTENVSARLDFIEASLAKLGVSRNARVLDAGCGTGRYAGKPVNDQTVDLPDGRLRFRSNTRIDHESLRMIVHERFDVQQNGNSVSTENVFVMRPWTTEEVAGFLHSSSLQQIGTGAGYGGSDQWLDRLVVTARKLGA